MQDGEKAILPTFDNLTEDACCCRRGHFVSWMMGDGSWVFVIKKWAEQRGRDGRGRVDDGWMWLISPPSWAIIIPNEHAMPCSCKLK